MKSPLDSAHTWFFECAVHQYPDTLEVQLVEGLKGQTAERVEIADGKSLGPFFPVGVHGNSRSASVIFRDVLAYQLINESLGSSQTDVKSDEGVLRKCTDLEYLKYLQTDSLIEQLYEGKYTAYFIWTEDQIVYVVCQEEPEVTVGAREPDLGIQRHRIYTAR